MKYFLDTEFHEYEKVVWTGEVLSNGGANLSKTSVQTIELISIGIVAEDGRKFYAVSNEFDQVVAWDNDWLRQNVLQPLCAEIFRFQTGQKYLSSDLEFGISKVGFSKSQIKEMILTFVQDDEKPEFYAYYADYDWVVFCWLFGRMIDLPKNFPMYCRDLKQMLDDYANKDGMLLADIKADQDYPKQKDEHNALADARWNKALFDFLERKNSYG